jgi:hypothetical protein
MTGRPGDPPRTGPRHQVVLWLSELRPAGEGGAKGGGVGRTSADDPVDDPISGEYSLLANA